ncbi:hypothetical protein PV08_04299 [Exophiala spinifera]|uniref:Uncharacterized protein n=1 Tax=Exophiala spinifera TaxID=91928 RepID=A0A0D2BDT4_9EURO|nr:uncharacterized protein PV08_04299 [Exophiala spinifera]KIW17108.1 hypothetical protein PV08_04299 [Exophiala spinifera]
MRPYHSGSPRPFDHLWRSLMLQGPPLTYLLHQYFSSLERLRLARDANNASSLSPRPSRLSILPSKAFGPATKPSRSAFLDFLILTDTLVPPGLLLNGNKLRKKRLSSTRSRNHVSQPTFFWFSSLPPAVQRRLFSPEECSFYKRETTTFILDAADETLRRRSSHPPRLSTSQRRASDEDTIVVDEDSKCEEKVDSAVDMGEYSTEGFRWLEDEPDLDLKIDDYHSAIAETNRRTASISEPVKRTTLKKRTTSLSSLSIRRGRASTSSARPIFDSTFDTPALPSKASSIKSSSFSLRHLRSQKSLSSLDPRATHYRDPAARMKLRLYLASPQKFDEAIEFGFPSVEDRSGWDRVRPMTSPHPRHEPNRTFFHDDTPSLSGDDSDNEDDHHDTMFDPRTPEEAVFYMHRPHPPPSSKLSIDGDGGVSLRRPSFMRRRPEAYARGSTTDREMTLRMTLTRPDLRSPDEEYRNKINAIPLERPELAAQPSPVSIWDTLPPAESKMKRFFRRLRLR